MLWNADMINGLGHIHFRPNNMNDETEKPLNGEMWLPNININFILLPFNEFSEITRNDYWREWFDWCKIGKLVKGKRS